MLPNMAGSSRWEITGNLLKMSRRWEVHTPTKRWLCRGEHVKGVEADGGYGESAVLTQDASACHVPSGR